MRPVLHGDIVAAARVLLRLPRAARRERIQVLIAAARLADAHRLRCGRAHPLYGNGSLMDAASRQPQAPEPLPEDAEYLACLRDVIEGLLEARRKGGRAIAFERPLHDTAP
ncbi:hypothetical protein [Alkalilacustris brevis]|uniref:DUF7742 family protein n=1 Tax=Alkalilacustris brevis TaxID=2026338 RepID=UPI000E0DB322|nr:hypothetical protein [Alkalilacustris brevis]